MFRKTKILFVKVLVLNLFVAGIMAVPRWQSLWPTRDRGGRPSFSSNPELPKKYTFSFFTEN